MNTYKILDFIKENTMLDRCQEQTFTTYGLVRLLTEFDMFLVREQAKQLQPTEQLQQADVIRWVSFCEELPNEGDDIVIFEDGYGAWSCKFEFDKDVDYSKSIWCFQPCV